MPTEHQHHASGTPTMVAALAAAAGFVDAFVFQHVTPAAAASPSGNSNFLFIPAAVSLASAVECRRLLVR